MTRMQAQRYLMLVDIAQEYNPSRHMLRSDVERKQSANG